MDTNGVGAHPIYRPLKTDQKEIRILYVEVEDENDSSQILELPTPGGSQVTLRFRFDTISLSDLDVAFYEAVSFSWNDSKEKATIIVDDNELQIPSKAESTLRAVCNLHGHTPVWLDAVCINQDDIEERNSQQSLMEEIYSKASRTLVWLGQAGGYAGQTTAALRELRAVIDQQFSIDWDTPHAWSLPNDATVTVFKHMPSSASWHAIYSLFANRWFTRAWIIEEVTTSTNVICYLGRQRIDWSEVAGSATWLYQHRKTLPLRPGAPSLSGITNVAGIWTMKCHESKILANMLQLVSSFDQREPEDMAQALLEMRLNDGRDSPFRPRQISNDDGPVRHIYARATRAAIVEKRNLALLKHAQSLRFPRGREPQDEVPSWAPRLDPSDYSILNPISSRSFQFNADDSVPLCLSACEDPRVLRVQGVMLDAVTEISPQMHWPLKGNRFSDAATAANVMRRTFIWTRRKLPTWPEAALARRFAFTVAAGQDASGRNFASARSYGKRLHNGFMDIAPISVVQGPLRLENTVLSSPDLDRNSMYAVEAMMKSGQNRTIFTTEQGRIGLGTENLQPGDRLCILFGGSVPFTLRQEDDHWRFIGDAFIEGIMFGSHVHDLKLSGKFQQETKWFDIR